jgi:hypothetical protein
MAAVKKNPSDPSWNATGAVLAAIVPRLTRSQRWHEYRVWEVWEDVVGGALARKARPAKIQNGKLFVIVSNSALMQELQFAKATLRERLNEGLGAAAVRDIMFVIGRAGGRAQRHPPPARRELPPYTELRVPRLNRPELEAALTKLLDARRKRLLQKGTDRVGITTGEPGEAL